MARARNLRGMKLHVNWVRLPGTLSSTYFSAKEAKEWMLGENSRLRVIGMGQVLYTVGHVFGIFKKKTHFTLLCSKQGQWVLHKNEDGEDELEFEVTRDVVHEAWI